MKHELKQRLIASQVALAMLWPVSPYAAAMAYGGQLAQFPMLSVLMTVVLSNLMGATALLHAMRQEYEAKGEIKRLWLFVASRMLSSNAAGLLMFFTVGSWDSVANSDKAAAIMLAAFGGTWTIERALQFFSNKYAPERQK